MTKTKSGKFNFTGVGLVGLLALVILGGGALLLNQNSPTFNVKSEGGKVGDIRTGDVKLSDINRSEAIKIGDVNQASNSSSATDTSSKTTQSSPANNSAQKVDVTATKVSWNLTYPVYKLEKDKCSVRGRESINLVQNQGNLNFSGLSNGYRSASISVTISSLGQVNLSLKGYNEEFLTFEGANTTSSPNSNATVITGKVTAPNCPDDKFQLSNGS